jgi:hypothetical protein
MDVEMICCGMWSEEDYRLMNKHQPEFFTPKARSPQVQPSQIVIEREVYVPPTVMSQRRMSVSMPMLAITPIPGQESTADEKIYYQYQPAILTLQAIPSTPPCSIPGCYTSTPKHEEPGVGEMLLGCAILLALCVATVAVLFFLVT